MSARLNFDIITPILAAVAIALTMTTGLYSCSARPQPQPTITVSIQPQKYLLDQIVGQRWQVRCLLSNGANPETYDPSMTHLLNLESSKAYMRMGNIPFESAIIDKIHNNNPDLRVFDTSKNIKLITGTHSHGSTDHTNIADPHTWTSVKNAKIIAANMRDAMIELDPANKTLYCRNHERLSMRLDSLDAAVSEILAPHAGATFLVWHPSLSYFARDYGLHQLSLSPEGKEGSVSMFQQSLDNAVKAKPRVFFFQKSIDSRQAETANSRIKAPMVSIDPLTHDWPGEILNIAHAIAQTNASK